jgi:acetyltransferase-like isoleucine patch superfamily enzyme
MRAMPARRNWRKAPWYARYVLGSRAATRAKLLVIKVTHLHCTVEFQGPVRLGPGFTLDIPDQGQLIVGPGVDFRNGFVCQIAGQGRVTIGAGTTFTSHALLQCTTSIEIGERCSFGQSTLIIDGSHRFRDSSKHLLDQGYDYNPIRIEDHATVMAKCSVWANIGRGAVVAAHSVVTKPIPAYCVAMGTPARVVEYFGPPDQRPDGALVRQPVAPPDS